MNKLIQANKKQEETKQNIYTRREKKNAVSLFNTNTNRARVKWDIETRILKRVNITQCSRQFLV